MIRTFSMILFIFTASCGSQPADRALEENRQALMDPTSAEMKEKAPDQFKAEFTTSKGKFVVEVTREWAPLGADRFYNLVNRGFYNNNRFFRVLPNFVVQFGINGDPEIAKKWTAHPQINPELHDKVAIKDDPVLQSNSRGFVVFAKSSAPHTRTTQLFVNMVDNGHLDKMGFAPFGKVTEGLDVVGSLYSEYGAAAQNRQTEIILEGNTYLQEHFPELDYIESAKIVD